MSKEYQKHIVSTPEHQVWLHRTFRYSLDKKLKEGLPVSQSGDLTGTASVQPDDLGRAEGIYCNGKDYGDTVLVLKFSRPLVDELKRDGIKLQDYAKDARIGYWHPVDKAYTVQRQHIHGWIDRKTGEYTPNPYSSEHQKLTEEHFPAELYGGLEKDLIELVRLSAKVKKKKTPLLKRGELPPPPSEINIVP